MTLSNRSEPIELKDEYDDAFNSNDIALEDWISLCMFFLLALILVAQVFSRYLLNAPLGWTEEVARYQLILLSFIGASMGFRKDTHISFIYFQTFIPQKIMPLYSVVLSVINSLFLCFLLATCIAIIPLLSSHEMSSLSLSISVLYSLLSVALALCLLRASISGVNNIKHLYFIREVPTAAKGNTSTNKDA